MDQITAQVNNQVGKAQGEITSAVSGQIKAAFESLEKRIFDAIDSRFDDLSKDKPKRGRPPKDSPEGNQ